MPGPLGWVCRSVLWAVGSSWRVSSCRVMDPGSLGGGRLSDGYHTLPLNCTLTPPCFALKTKQNKTWLNFSLNQHHFRTQERAHGGVSLAGPGAWPEPWGAPVETASCSRIPRGSRHGRGADNGFPSLDFSVGPEVFSLPLSFSWLTETWRLRASRPRVEGLPLGSETVIQKDQVAREVGVCSSHQRESPCSTFGFLSSKLRKEEIGRLDQTLVRSRGPAHSRCLNFSSITMKRNHDLGIL